MTLNKGKERMVLDLEPEELFAPSGQDQGGQSHKGVTLGRNLV